MTNFNRTVQSLLLASAAASTAAFADEAPVSVSQGYGWQSQSSSTGSSASGLDSLGSGQAGTTGAATGSTIYAQLQQALQSGQNNGGLSSPGGIQSPSGLPQSGFSSSGGLPPSGLGQPMQSGMTPDQSQYTNGTLGQPALGQPGVNQPVAGAGVNQSAPGYATAGDASGVMQSVFGNGSGPNAAQTNPFAGNAAPGGTQNNPFAANAAPGGTQNNPFQRNTNDRKPAGIGSTTELNSDTSTADDDAAAPLPSANKDGAPLHRALQDMQSKNFDGCIGKLDKILQTDPRNAQAHYLKAVAYVMTRHYSQAADEYRATLRYSTTSELTKLAETGLAKLHK